MKILQNTYVFACKTHFHNCESITKTLQKPFGLCNTRLQNKDSSMTKHRTLNTVPEGGQKDGGDLQKTVPKEPLKQYSQK